jgi:hypothetical protein
MTTFVNIQRLQITALSVIKLIIWTLNTMTPRYKDTQDNDTTYKVFE